MGWSGKRLQVAGGWEGSGDAPGKLPGGCGPVRDGGPRFEGHPRSGLKRLDRAGKGQEEMTVTLQFQAPAAVMGSPDGEGGRMRESERCLSERLDYEVSGEACISTFSR